MRFELVALMVAIVATSAPASARVADGDSCRRLPADKRLKLNLKPNTDLVDLVSWISAITCKQFIVPGSIPPQSKTVTVVSPQPITVAEAYDLFLEALESVGLTVYSSRGVMRVVETAKIASHPIPVVVRDLDDQD
jgi:type II secretory pathway component GspD/PulD (secretin)